jgi:hypothetical protein
MKGLALRRQEQVLGMPAGQVGPERLALRDGQHRRVRHRPVHDPGGIEPGEQVLGGEGRRGWHARRPASGT